MPLPRAPGVNVPIGNINSIQRGVSFLPAGTVTDDEVDITITSVNTAKAVCRLLGARTFGPIDTPLAGVQRSHVTMQLINSTTLRFSRHMSVPVVGPNNPATEVSWEVTEYQ